MSTTFHIPTTICEGLHRTLPQSCTILYAIFRSLVLQKLKVFPSSAMETVIDGTRIASEMLHRLTVSVLNFGYFPAQKMNEKMNAPSIMPFFCTTTNSL